MMRFVRERRPFPWRKVGRVYEPAADGLTHGSHPCAVHIAGDRWVIAFTRRDNLQRSHVFLVNAIVRGGAVVLQGEPKCALQPGQPGWFDCDGAISVCFVKHRGVIYLYYVGWQNLPDTLWICDTGRAVLDPDAMALERQFQGPVLARDKDNPLFAAATAFHVEGDKWMTWYNSGLRWERTPQGWRHCYGVHYAESDDGVDWRCFPGMCIPFATPEEYAFGRPSVVRDEGTFLMWYAHRATPKAQAYRIGFAHSANGRQWTRDDANAGIDVSPEGWDSEMICYPYVFAHEGVAYMLYNGNSYGKTGFGLAILGND